MKETAFFPGKFQPPHMGHVLTISKLLKEYDVVIGISEDGPRVTTQEEVKEIFEMIFGERARCFPFKGILTQYEKLENFPHFDVLITGNDEVVKWAKSINIRTKKVPRSLHWSGTELRRLL